MSTMPSQLMSPRMHGVGVGVGVTVEVATVVAVAVAVAVGVAVGKAISVSTVARLLVSIGSPLAILCATFTTFVVVRPLGVPACACTVRVKVVVAPDARGPGGLGRTHSTRPTFPTAGLLQTHPAGEARETNVVSGGVASLIVALAAAFGPLFVSVIV
jgi:hypothetical protein